MTIKDTILNAILLVKYKYFRNYIKPKDFGKPVFTANFNSDKYSVSDGSFYSTNMVTDKNNVEVKEGILNLYARPYNKEFTDWSGLTRFIEWSVGWTEWQNLICKPYGVFSATLKLPKDAWSAFWLLRRRHWNETTLRKYTVSKVVNRQIFLNEPFERIDYNWFVLSNREFMGFVVAYNVEQGYVVLDRDILYNPTKIEIGPDHIIPEVDVMETMQKNGKSIVKHTLHYRYELFEYNGRSGGPWICEADEDWHTYSVEISKTGYKFYIDGYLTGVYTDPISIESVGAYPILNNAVHPGRKQEELVMQVKDLKYYE